MQLPRAFACSCSKPVELLHLLLIQFACANSRLAGLARRSLFAKSRVARPVRECEAVNGEVLVL